MAGTCVAYAEQSTAPTCDVLWCRSELNFRQFVRKLARFRKVRPQQSTQFNNRDAKLRFLFGMYDLDMDGKISRNELLGMLQMMVGANITVEQVRPKNPFHGVVNREVITALIPPTALKITVFKN
ncbi:unnamed protein product [Schistosoma mattheei]|uniref:Uncharacterized protein n=1 Tax=Schistosoma mattheei TaxID=31246 RepID=A0A183Q368_9TREM|nr:unnamed protein product [Schistosoma mattheei]